MLREQALRSPRAPQGRLAVLRGDEVRNELLRLRQRRVNLLRALDD